MIDLIFENFQIFLVIGLALAAWLKNRANAKEEEEAERAARERMARQIQEQKERTAQKAPPPVPETWDTRPNPAPQPAPSSEQSTPPQLKDIFKEVAESVAPTPAAAKQTERKWDAYDDEPAPWRGFQHADASHSEIDDVDHDPLESPMLRRQREMQDRLAEIKKQTAQFKGKTAGARETQRRLERRGQEEIAAMPGIASVLKDRAQTRRAIVLNEILSKPLGLRS